MMCFHPILLLDVLRLWAALFSLRERVDVSLARLRNTSGTMLVLFLLFSVLGWQSPRENKMAFFFFFFLLIFIVLPLKAKALPHLVRLIW